MNDLPYTLVIVEVIRHTPVWAWGILVAITLLGLRQAADHHITRWRLAAAPVGLGGFSLWSAASAFGVTPGVFALWLAGAVVAAVALRGAWPTALEHPAPGRYRVPGSWWPLAAMWAVFGVRYLTAVTLVFHPEWARDAMFSSAMPLVYGGLTGVFAARALRIVQPLTAPLQAAR